MSNAHSADLSEIQAYVDDLESRLSAARAGYIDNINNSNLATIADISSLTATEIAYLDAKVSEVIKQVALTGHPGDSLGKILYDFYNTRLTSARCGYLANINNANLATIADISTLTATEIAHLDADISGVGAVPVFKWNAVENSYKAMVGTWGLTDRATDWLGVFLQHDVTSDNLDSIALGNLHIPASAAYTVHIIHEANVDKGILHFLLNGVDKANIDCYVDPTAANTESSVSLGTLAAGDYILSLLMSGKHASSSSYALDLQSLVIMKT